MASGRMTDTPIAYIAHADQAFTYIHAWLIMSFYMNKEKI